MGWTDVVTAISTTIVAVILVFVLIVLVGRLREARHLIASIERVVHSLDRDARPAIDAARGMIDDAAKVMASVRAEVDGYAEYSEDLRERLGDLTESVEGRLGDLEALIDVLHEEIEETALDVASALRTTRRGVSVARALKRVFLGRGR